MPLKKKGRCEGDRPLKEVKEKIPSDIAGRARGID